MPFDSPASRTTDSAPILPVEMHDVVFTAGGKRLLDGLTLRIEAGTRTVIMGPNGAGKSLTLRLLQGLITPSAGSITWAGLTRRGDGRHGVAMVFQRPVLLRRSVAANMRHALKAAGVPRAARRSRVDELLSMAGLAPLADRPARVLSAGEQQRLSLVRALAARPVLLLLDEPTANLDPASTQAIETLIDTAHRGGTKFVFVTHDAGQAARLADDIVFIHGGRVAEHTPAASFFAAPESEAARAYLAGRIYI